MGNIVLKITALIFGIALWFLVISQKDFQLSVNVPLNFVKLPETMAIASKPPHSLHITVEGKSWDLIRLNNLVSDPKQNSPDIRFVEPENQLLFVDLDIDTRITRNVPIKSVATFTAAQGYLIADEPTITPEELMVSGARNALTRIIDIPTDSSFYDTLHASQEFTIPLDFSMLPAFVSPSDSSVKISVNIQKMASRTYDSIPVSLIGFFDKQIYSLEPKSLSVEITIAAGTDDPVYRHYEGNSHAHMKSTTFGASQTLIIEESAPIRGIWQAVYFCEFDGPRNSTYYVKVIEG